MPKPYGLTPFMQVVVPSRIQDKIWDVVQECVEAEMSVEDFKREILEAWTEARKDQLKREQGVLRDA